MDNIRTFPVVDTSLDYVRDFNYLLEKHSSELNMCRCVTFCGCPHSNFTSSPCHIHDNMKMFIKQQVLLQILPGVRCVNNLVLQDCKGKIKMHKFVGDEREATVAKHRKTSKRIDMYVRLSFTSSVDSTLRQPVSSSFSVCFQDQQDVHLEMIEFRIAIRLCILGMILKSFYRTLNLNQAEEKVPQNEMVEKLSSVVTVRRRKYTKCFHWRTIQMFLVLLYRRLASFGSVILLQSIVKDLLLYTFYEYEQFKFLILLNILNED